MIFKRSLYLLFCFVFLTAFGFGQDNPPGRPRIVKQTSSQPTNLPQKPTDKTNSTILSQPVKNSSQRPTLTNKIVVVGQSQQPLVKKTADVKPTNLSATAAVRFVYNPSISQSLGNSIKSKLGVPYRYNTIGPNRYDCSGFVWSVFSESGILFERSSAANYWASFEPVYGDDRYKFGTLVFFNRLGHVGIVADEKGFYHASSSKGITYSPFEGYWEKRIVGFRRIPTSVTQASK
jgi:cell wall-associated NlpC family hydrolase